MQAREVLARHAKSFRWASLFLSPRQCDQAAIAYAYCRAVDDAVDEAPDQATALCGLQQAEDAISGTISGDITTQAYIELAHETGFGLAPAQALLEGARADLGPVFLRDDSELLTYCYRVAGTVGLMMCGILRVTDQNAQKHAVDLGIAMQLTNICRDVLEDARRGRVYLPESRMRAVGLSQRELIEGASFDATPSLASSSKGAFSKQLTAGVSSVVRDLLQLADQRYRSAALGYLALPPRARLSVMVAADLYRAIGQRLLLKWEGNALRGRVSVSPLGKVALTVRSGCCWLLSLLPSRPRGHRIASLDQS